MAQQFPYDAKTNKPTLLIRLVDESIRLKKGRAVKIYEEDDYFGQASIKEAGKSKFGLVPRKDYDPA